MARFVFGLQTVLEQREIEELLCKKELYEAQLVQKRHMDRLAEVEVDIRTANDTMRDQHLVGPLQPTVIATHRRYLIAMKQQVFSLADQIASARVAVEAKQRKLALASKNKRAIELLRDKQKARWSMDQDRKELAAADDVAMQIAYHNLQMDGVGGSAA